jgi:hypothetical protein
VSGYRRLWIGLAAVMAALPPTTALAAGVSFATPSGLPALPPMYGVTCLTATTCVAVGGSGAGTVVTTSDGGRTWTAKQVPGIVQLNGVSCLEGAHCVAVGAASSSAAAIAVTSDGRTWRAIGSLPASVPLSSVSCVAPSRCMAVGSTFSGSTFTASALFSFDDGATWTTAATPTFKGQQTTLNAVDCPAAQRCFAVGGNAWVTNNFGGTWQDISPPDGCAATAGLCAPTYSDLTGLDFTDATHGVVAGGEQCGGQGVTQCTGAYFSTANAGVSWTKSPSTGQASFPFIEDVNCNGRSCLVNSDAFSSSSILLTSEGVGFTRVGNAAGTLDAISCAPTGPCVDVGYDGTAGVLLDSATGIGPATRTVTPPTSSRAGPGPTENAASSVVSSFGTSLPTPAAVGSSAPALLLSALLVLVLVLFVVFPSQLFNRTYEENHERIRSWWERRLPWTRSHRERAQARALHGAMALAVAVVVGSVLGTLLDPHAGFTARSAALFVGIALSMLFWMGLTAAVNAAYRRARHRGTRWELRALPSGLMVAALCVGVSRAVNFQPGYLYGIIGGVAFAGVLPRKDEGHLVALTSTATLVAAVIAWLLWVPAATAAARPGAGFGSALLANVLSALFVGGLAGVVLGLVPLRFLPGQKLAAWHWGAWTTIFALATFGLVQIMLRPQSSAAHLASVPLWTTVGLFLAFGAASIAFWGYFRGTAAQEAATGHDAHEH